MNEIEEKKEVGRPSEYTDDILIKAKEYIDSCTDEIDEYHKTRGDKSDGYERLIRVKLPTIEGLAVHLGIGRTTLYEWKEKFPQFACIIEELQAIQADRLINNGMSGDYNPTIAKVLLSKHGYREGIEQTGLDGKDLIPDKQSKEKSDKALNEFLDGPNKGNS